jgi:predicted alpha/beta hydrolase family esterase
MRKQNIVILVLVFVGIICTQATSKVYLIHGYGGLGIELREIQKVIEKEGFVSEIYSYPSLVKDVDSVGNRLFHKIQKENYDTVSFVTHSLGALVVRSIYEHLDTLTTFPFIHRIVMIAPPNNGSPVADFFAQFKFVKLIIGPNINNITTNPLTGAGKYPIPTCEVGLIAGSLGGKRGYNIFVKGDNDGVLLPEKTKMGIEKDVVFVKSGHIELLFNKKVKVYVTSFLTQGKFKPA